MDGVNDIAQFTEMQIYLDGLPVVYTYMLENIIHSLEDFPDIIGCI